MGNTTIIELNHDRALEIERDPQGFLEAIKEQLRSGRLAGMEIPGGHVIAFFPRWTGVPAYEAWVRWRAQWESKRKYGTARRADDGVPEDRDRLGS